MNFHLLYVKFSTSIKVRKIWYDAINFGEITSRNTNQFSHKMDTVPITIDYHKLFASKHFEIGFMIFYSINFNFTSGKKIVFKQS